MFSASCAPNVKLTINNLRHFFIKFCVYYTCRMLFLSLYGEIGKRHHQKLTDHVMLSLLGQLYTSELVGLDKCTHKIVPVKSDLDY